MLEPDPVELASVGLGGGESGKGKGPNNPDDARWSGEARYGNILHSFPCSFSLISISFAFIPSCSRAGGFGDLNQDVKIDFGAATTKVLELKSILPSI